jgi:c-di-GMP-binding flagellar brake protein YcgR
MSDDPGTKPPTEKRQHRRYPVKVPIFISIDGGIFRKTVRLESRDISAGGLSFETGREVPLEAESRVVVARIGDLAEPALIQGKVAHIHHDLESGRFTVGIQFTGFDNVTPEELERRIENWQS